MVLLTQAHAELNLITLLLLLVMVLKTELNSILLETHGPPDGESKDTLESLLFQELVSVVFNKHPSGQKPTEDV